MLTAQERALSAAGSPSSTVAQVAERGLLRAQGGITDSHGHLPKSSRTQCPGHSLSPQGPETAPCCII